MQQYELSAQQRRGMRFTKVVYADGAPVHGKASFAWPLPKSSFVSIDGVRFRWPGAWAVPGGHGALSICHHGLHLAPDTVGDLKTWTLYLLNGIISFYKIHGAMRAGVKLPSGYKDCSLCQRPPRMSWNKSADRFDRVRDGKVRYLDRYDSSGLKMCKRHFMQLCESIKMFVAEPSPRAKVCCGSLSSVNGSRKYVTGKARLVCEVAKKRRKLVLDSIWSSLKSA